MSVASGRCYSEPQAAVRAPILPVFGLAMLEGNVKFGFEIPTWNLRIEFQEWRPKWWELINADGRREMAGSKGGRSFKELGARRERSQRRSPATRNCREEFNSGGNLKNRIQARYFQHLADQFGYVCEFKAHSF